MSSQADIPPSHPMPGGKFTADFWKTIGIPQRGQALYDRLYEGLPYDVYKRLARIAGLHQKELARFVLIALSTLRHRVEADRFTPEESDRLYRFARVFKAALDLFEGDLEAAREWLTTPVRGLGGKRPADMLGTSAETEAVLELVGRLEHGVVA